MQRGFVAPVLVAPQAKEQRRMGVVEVDGATEDELRTIAIRTSFEALDNEALPLAPGEYTLRQWADRYEEEYGVRISETTARRKLEKLIEQGKVARGRRKAASGYSCIAYWTKGDDVG